jgi:hypothetical protein
MMKERDATKSTMDPEFAKSFVIMRRLEERALMEARAVEIENGLVHESYAAELIRLRGH